MMNVIMILTSCSGEVEYPPTSLLVEIEITIMLIMIRDTYYRY